MKLFGRFKGRMAGSASPDPGSPHRFRPMNDPGMAAAAAGGSGTSTGAALGMDATVTGNFVREQWCGVPGCGRDRDDPIHFPEG
jgi:hypothetical protein